MKRMFLLTVALMIGIMLSAQTQQGYVKTKGRMVDGKHIPGHGLKGATVSVHGRTAVLVNAEDGSFSFPVPEARFRVDSVRKNGYQLVDMDALSKTYSHSANPIYFVMETPEQRLQDQLAAQQKIRHNLTNQLRQKEDEIKLLKEQQKISKEEYYQAMQKLYEETDKNEQLVNEMAKRYSEIDYDQMDEFYSQVSYCIENGELVKAASLLDSRGDITEQVDDLLYRGKTLQEEREQLQKAEAVQQADIDEAAQRCYSYFETFAAQYLNDTAAYYLELRVKIDTTNVEWILEAQDFLREYLSRYDKALKYCQLGLRQSLKQFGENNEMTAKCYNDIGVVYGVQSNCDSALLFLNKSLVIQKTLQKENRWETASTYNNIGYVYNVLSDYENALINLNKALTILDLFDEDDHADLIVEILTNLCETYFKQGDYQKALDCSLHALNLLKNRYSDDNVLTAVCCNNIGVIYSSMQDYNNALSYCDTALNINKNIFGNHHPSIVTDYCNIGDIYEQIGEYAIAIEYYQNSLDIAKAIFGEKHIRVAFSYNHLGSAYSQLGDYDKAIEYHDKALSIWVSILGDNHPRVATACGLLGFVYERIENYDKALEYHEKALAIEKSYFGDSHDAVANSYYQMASIYTKMDRYDMALEYLSNTLTIWKAKYGENYYGVAACYNCMGNLYYQQNDYDNALVFYNKTLTVYSLTLDLQHPYVAICYANLGNVYSSLNNNEKALEYYNLALSIQEAKLGPEQPETIKTKKRISDVQSKLKEQEESSKE